MEYDNKLIEKFVEIVKRKNEVKVEDVVKALQTDSETLMKIACILNEHEIIRLNYNIVGEAVVKPGPNIDKKVEGDVSADADKRAIPEPQNKIVDNSQKSRLDSSEDKTEKVSRVIYQLRKRIADKKIKNIEKLAEQQAPTGK
ncbi:MAG: hypothetical protein NTU61_04390 [Candidatus Altiarchaeota archaeon]|nr:hypothetical protein [Candidatus Altiarchaeota archaeon]